MQLVFCTLQQGPLLPFASIETIPDVMNEKHLQLSSIRLHGRKREFLRTN